MLKVHHKNLFTNYVVVEMFLKQIVTLLTIKTTKTTQWALDKKCSENNLLKLAHNVWKIQSSTQPTLRLLSIKNALGMLVMLLTL